MQKRQQIVKIFLVLFLFFNSNLWAQENTDPEIIASPGHVQIIDNGDGGENDIWEMDGCPVPVHFKIQLAYLKLNPVNGTYHLPQGTPAILFRCQFGEEVFDFYPTTFVKEGYLGTSTEIYSWETTVSVSMETNCTVNPNGILKSTRILRADNGLIYPMIEHSGEEGIFTCKAFHETKNCCDGACGTNESLHYENAPFEILCLSNVCNDGVYSPDQTYEPGEDNPHAMVQVLPDVLSIYPNPSRTNASLDLELEEDTIVELTIFNTAGQLIWQQKETANKGHYQTKINTEKWLPGVYIGQIRYGDRQEAFRLSKL